MSIKSILFGAAAAALILMALASSIYAADNVASQILYPSVSGTIPVCSSPRYVDQIYVASVGGIWDKFFITVGLQVGGTFDIGNPDLPGVAAILFPITPGSGGSLDEFLFPDDPGRSSGKVDLCSVRIASNLGLSPITIAYTWSGTGDAPPSSGTYALVNSGRRGFTVADWQILSSTPNEKARYMRAQVNPGEVTKVFIGHSAVTAGYPDAIGVELWGETAGGNQRSGHPETWSWTNRRLDKTAVKATVPNTGFILATWDHSTSGGLEYQAGTTYATNTPSRWTYGFPYGVSYARWQVSNGGTKDKIYFGDSGMTVDPLYKVGKILFPTSSNGGASEYYYAIPRSNYWSVPVSNIYLATQPNRQQAQIVRWEAVAGTDSLADDGNSIAFQTFNLTGSSQQLGYNSPPGSGALTGVEISNVPGQMGQIMIGKCGTLQGGNALTAGVVLQPNPNGKWLSTFQMNFAHLATAPIDPQYICLAGNSGEQVVVTKVVHKDRLISGGFGRQPKTAVFDASTVAQRLASSSTPVNFFQVQPIPGGACLTDVGSEAMLGQAQPDPNMVGRIKTLWPTNGQGHNGGVADVFKVVGGSPDLYKYAAFGRCLGDRYAVFGY